MADRVSSGALVLALLFSIGCARPPSVERPAPVVEHTPPRPSAPKAVPFELTADEVLSRKRIVDSTRELVRLGPLDAEHPWELADAAELLTRLFEEAGVNAVRATEEADGAVFHSFTATFQGEGAPFEVLTFYDSGPASAASDRFERALSTAATLELVRLVGPARFERALRISLVARATAAPLGTYLGGAARGRHGLVLGHGLGAASANLTAVDGTGRQSREGPDSSPVPVAASSPSVWERDWDRALVDELRSEPFATSSLSYQRAGAGAVPGWLELSRALRVGPDPSGVRPPAAAIESGVAEPRANLSESADFDRATARTSKIRAFLAEMLGERPTNDEMVTPLYGAVR